MIRLVDTSRLHVLCNAIVVYHSFADTLLTYRQPAIVSYMSANTDTRSCVIILSLHLYHIFAFQPLVPIDWVHHGVMIIIMLPFAYAMQPGPMLNHGCFCKWFARWNGLYYAYMCEEKVG